MADDSGIGVGGACGVHDWNGRCGIYDLKKKLNITELEYRKLSLSKVVMADDGDDIAVFEV